MAILTATDALSIPVGFYLLKLNACTVVDGTNYRSGEPEKQLQWSWRVERVMEAEPSEEQSEVVGQEYREWTSIICSPNSKARARAVALLGREMEHAEEIDTDAHTGKRVKAMFESYVGAKGGIRTKIATLAAYTGKTPTEPSANGAPSAASAAEMSGAANGGQSPSDTPLAALRAAYAANVGDGKKWKPEDATQLLADLYGVDHSSRLQPDQMVELTGILNDSIDVAFNQEGKYVVGLPF